MSDGTIVLNYGAIESLLQTLERRKQTMRSLAEEVNASYQRIASSMEGEAVTRAHEYQQASDRALLAIDEALAKLRALADEYTNAQRSVDHRTAGNFS